MQQTKQRQTRRDDVEVERLPSGDQAARERLQEALDDLDDEIAETLADNELAMGSNLSTVVTVIGLCGC